MTQLAVDKRSKTFALAVPVFYKAEKPSYKKGVVSEVAVFTLEDDRPVLVQVIPILVISLVPVPGSAGFVAIDSAAHVLAVIQATAINPLAAPLSDLQLDKVADHDDQDAMEVDDEDESNGNKLLLQLNGNSDAMDEDNDADEMEDMETYNAILVPEKLTQIFDGAPAFALPPIEDLFYQVSELISPKAVPSSA
uniref:Sporulation protein n=1 Tax=Pyricularia grisea TaxID=148305 RepID=O42623_PYRGI|nr:sporulation protein [Pyricularia grisea]